MDHVLVEWFAVVFQSSKGRIFLSNLWFDVDHRRVMPGKLGTFLKAIGLRLTGSPPVNDPVEVCTLVADGAPDEYLCQGPPVEPVSISKVLNAVALVSHNIDHRYTPLAITPSIVEGVVEELLLHGIDGRTRGLLGGARACVWVTQTSALDELRTTTAPNRLANEVRDAAGLDHFHRSEHLLELQYPDDSPAVGQLRAPTFMDGGASYIFRCCAGVNGWGAAVQLGTLHDGVPEAVHRPIPWTPHFRLLDFGHLDGTCPPYDADAFERKMLYQWRSDFVPKIEDYVLSGK